MRIGKQDAPFTSICTSDATSITVRGMDLCSEVIGQVDFTSYFWLLVTGTMPSPPQKALADAVLRFVTDLRVPFTNNLGERAICMPEVKQKISGCFRTLKGAQDFCTIRSYLDTMHKQGHNLFEVLRSTFMGCAPLPASR